MSVEIGSGYNWIASCLRDYPIFFNGDGDNYNYHNMIDKPYLKIDYMNRLDRCLPAVVDRMYCYHGRVSGGPIYIDCNVVIDRDNYEYVPSTIIFFDYKDWPYYTERLAQKYCMSKAYIYRF